LEKIEERHKGFNQDRGRHDVLGYEDLQGPGPAMIAMKRHKEHFALYGPLVFFEKKSQLRSP
jgi:hypothetical protein